VLKVLCKVKSIISNSFFEVRTYGSDYTSQVNDTPLSHILDNLTFTLFQIHNTEETNLAKLIFIIIKGKLF